MYCKSLPILLAVLFTGNAFAQAKVFQFNEIQCRNERLQWEKSLRTEDRVVYIAEDSIDVTLDKYYHLSIISKTLLPNRGAIYLCRDQQQKVVTVTLVEGEKMFLYDDTNRFRVNFTQSGFAPAFDSFADSDD